MFELHRFPFAERTLLQLADKHLWIGLCQGPIKPSRPHSLLLFLFVCMARRVYPLLLSKPSTHPPIHPILRAAALTAGDRQT